MRTVDSRFEGPSRAASSAAGSAPATAYWTIAEAAAFARVSPKRLRNLMANSILREGVHYTRPRGMRPRFKREALIDWLEGRSDAPSRHPNPVRSPSNAPAIDLTLLERVGTHRNGV